VLNFIPDVKGKFLENYILKKLTWFQVGGPSRFFYKPKDTEDLAFFMNQRPKDIPFFVLGAGSNLLIRDGGYEGITIKLPAAFSNIDIENDVVIAGAAVLDRTLALFLAEKGLSHLEFFVGIPGTVGGAVAMNAGAYGSETIDHLLWIEVMLQSGEVQRLNKKDLSMSYRCGNLPKDAIVLKAAFQLAKKDVALIHQDIKDILQKRSDTQPVMGRTGGSTFKNTPTEAAWKLIDDAGCRGHIIGDAQISEKHCNFLINRGNATASDIENLGEYVRQKVSHNSGINLEWEIKRIGQAECLTDLQCGKD
jgi:UDP-N-acetylmuramate dehydrogenase